MERHEYAGYDAVGIRDLIRADEVEATARRALAVTNAQMNGLALSVFFPALDHAGDGPFAGVPFLIKDHGPVAEGVPLGRGDDGLPIGVQVIAPYGRENPLFKIAAYLGQAMPPVFAGGS